MIVVALILTALIQAYCYGFSGEINATAVAVAVHDGDTFRLDRNVNGSDTVRLADINASELGQPLSYEARDFLKGLVLAKTVYLDIDNIYVYDYSGTGDRLICVVYVDYNSTHYENVNKALLTAGLAETKEYYNEFNSDTWTLYVPKTDLIPEFSTSPVLVLLMLLTTLTATVAVRKKHYTSRALFEIPIEQCASFSRRNQLPSVGCSTPISLTFAGSSANANYYSTRAKYVRSRTMQTKKEGAIQWFFRRIPLVSPRRLLSSCVPYRLGVPVASISCTA
jgi:endonuclease YncB( thermonuclease family)